LNQGLAEHIESNHMNKQALPTKPNFDHLNPGVEGYDSLAELALDLRWSWNHGTDDMWRQLDSPLWELTQNPWAVLQTASRDKLKSVLTDPAFRKQVDE
jgi:starch phosphorylase